MTTRKLWDIDYPPVLLVVGPPSATSSLAGALEDDTELRIERVEDPGAVRARIEERPAVDCCWIAPADATEKWIDLVGEIRDADDTVRLVFAPTAGDASDAARATAAGAAEFVDPSASLDQRRKRAIAAVERAIERRHDATKRSMLDAFVEGLEANVFVKDEQARHLVHPSDVTTGEGRELFGLTDLEAFGTHEETLSDAYQDDLAVVREGKRIDGKVERYPEFQQGWQWTTKVPWTDEGETRGLVGMTMEVSEWKNRERELLQQLGYLQRIPRYLTHDLRNPLSIARGYVEPAREGDPDAVDAIEDSLDRMTEKLDDFHGLIAGGSVEEQEREPIQFVRVVEDVWSHVALPGADLEIDASPDARILADEQQFRPLLQNVFRNAIDHAGPRVTVQVELTGDGFSVGDDGPGLQDWSGQELFDTGTSTAADGAGLGLAIVREVAHLHGWDVETGVSELGGAQFTFGNCMIGRPTAATSGDDISLETSTDVGSVDVPGTATIEGDTATISGAGANLWGKINEFHFAYAMANGDVRVEAELAEMTVASEHSKAGLMIRSGLEESASYGAIARMADRFPEALYRQEPGDRGSSFQAEGIDADWSWFAVERIGETIYLSVSTDGESWMPLDHRDVSLGEEIVVGAFVCSVADGQPIEARFENVSISSLE